jgi:predicted permease
MLTSVLQDLRHSLRLLRKSPGFTVVAVLTLALGIGGTTTIFTLVDAAMFRPLPGVREPAQLVWLASAWRGRSRIGGLSYPDLQAFREGAGEVFEVLAAYSPSPVSLGSGGEPARLRGHMVTGDYFAALGTRVALGRPILRTNDSSGASPVAVIGASLWRSRFASDPAIVGQSIVLNGHRFTVAGVAEEGFTGPELGAAAEVWIPLSSIGFANPAQAGALMDRGASWLQAIGRLRDGVSLARARATLGGIAARLERAYPATNQDRLVTVAPASSGLAPATRGEMVPIAALLLAVTGVVLFIACFNVANLLLARAAGRTREIGIRLAIGAGRRRLLHQLLTESFVLAAIGGAAGLIVSLWASDVLLALADQSDLAGLSAAPDARILLFAAAVSIGTGLLFGAAPALHGARADVVSALRDRIGAGAGIRGSRLQRGFVVAQLALSLVLLAGAGLFLSALSKSSRVDLGFDPRNVLVASFDLPLQGYDDERRRGFERELVDRVSTRSRDHRASLASVAPLSGIMVGTGIGLPDSPDAEQSTFVNSVSPGYFRTLGIALLRGRDFDWGDRAGAPPVAIVNDTLARRLWDEGNPVGRTVRLAGEDAEIEVIGVARDSKYDEAGEDPRPHLYLPLAQRTFLPRTTLLLRSPAPVPAVVDLVKSEIRRLDPALPLFDVSSLERIVALRLDRQRSISALLTAFGGLALALAAIGLYGVMAFAVTHRTREIAVRLALGASPTQIVRQFVGDGLRLAATGAGLGTILALPLAPAAGSFVLGVSPFDVATFAIAASALTCVGLLATCVPAARALRIAPAVTLKVE